VVKYVLAWVPMVLIGIANGVARVATYGKYMSELRAHQLSTLTGVLLVGLYIFGVSKILRFESGRKAFLVGIMWFLLTDAFEFIFGHYVAGHEWSILFSDYNLAAGRLWLVFLLWILAAPYVFFRLSKRNRAL
jgi:hypothetical protein